MSDVKCIVNKILEGDSIRGALCEATDTIIKTTYFDLVSTEGVGRNNTHWYGLKVVSKGLAEKHVVEVRLISDGPYPFDGEDVHYTYSGCYVAHGMRGEVDTLKDTQEYIKVLEAAVDFAKQVNSWLKREPGQYIKFDIVDA